MAARRALITGAGGFVGAVLARRLLADGHEVVLVGRAGSDQWRLDPLRADAEVLELDLRDPDAVAATIDRTRPQWVFQLAAHGAYSWQDSLPQMIETNLAAVSNVVEAATRADAEAVVQAGSSSEYGFMDHAPSEDELPEPNSAYAVTKAAATLYCGWVARSRDQAVTTLRLYSAYGPWEDPRRLVPALVTHGLRGELPPLVNPDIARDFVYVDDVAEAFVLAAQGARPGEGAVYNVGSGVQTSLRELVEATRRVLAVVREPEWGSFPERDWDTATWVANAQRIRTALNWAPRHTLEQGLGAMARWLGEEPGVAERYSPAPDDLHAAADRSSLK
jgi:UDP-glucose 4-epimerase